MSANGHTIAAAEMISQQMHGCGKSLLVYAEQPPTQVAVFYDWPAQ
jgi:hypothetical protein